MLANLEEPGCRRCAYEFARWQRAKDGQGSDLDGLNLYEFGARWVGLAA